MVSQQKWNHLSGLQQKVTGAGGIWIQHFCALFFPLPSWSSDEVPKPVTGVTGTGQQELRRWLPDQVRGKRGSQGWSFPQALGWDTSIDLSCWLWNLSAYFISVTCSISWGVSHFMHCVEKYFNKVLNSDASFDTALLFELEEVNGNTSLCIFCQLSPVHPFSLPGLEFLG